MKNEKIIRIAYDVSRWIVGLTFLFSSFSKGVDPLGTSYKIQEYMTAWSIGSFSFEWALPMATFLSVAMITLEFFVGVLLITNCWRKLGAWLLLLMMSFFTITTFIDALTNKVTDCGCFGDMVKLTNWETFGKNVVLMVFTIIVFCCRSKFSKKRTFERDILVAFFSIGVAISFQLYNIANEPILDFRSWKIGNRMMPEEKGEVVTYLKYKNKTSGEIDEFTSDKLMDYYKDTAWVSNWEFVDSRIEDPNEIYADGFSMMDPTGEDYAKDIIGSPDYVLIATIHHLNDIDDKGIRRMKQVYRYAQERGLYMVLLVSVSSSQTEVVDFLLENKMDNIEFYYADEKAIETMLRSNPGFILLRNSVVVNKWHHSNVGDLIAMTTEDFE
ncbi:MAG: DoxX family protein [Bacteroidales bacterium]|nr:DoxX family protein [Bacteroidales bacterium]